MKSNSTNARNVVTSGRSKYLDILNAAWELHLAPRAANAPTVISTFAGGGGSSLGYSMAGFKELLAVEWDNNAVETFKLNFPDVPVYHGDISKLSVDEVFKLTGLKEGQLDVFDGSPPCQGFSTAGKREMSDSRNMLFREYVRLLRGLKPKVFVMENVSGMVKGKMKLIFAEIMRELKASGYKVSARLMNAMYFNVPQSRQRMIFIGVRDDLGIQPSHPDCKRQPVTVADAWQGLSVKNDAPTLSAHTASIWQRTLPGCGVGYQSSIKLSFKEPSPTIRKDASYGGLFHPSECRPINTAERKRLASFPDKFQFIDWGSCCQRIGNSVPPLFMKAIAEHIRQEVLDKINA